MGPGWLCRAKPGHTLKSDCSAVLGLFWRFLCDLTSLSLGLWSCSNFLSCDVDLHREMHDQSILTATCVNSCIEWLLSHLRRFAVKRILSYIATCFADVKIAHISLCLTFSCKKMLCSAVGYEAKYVLCISGRFWHALIMDVYPRRRIYYIIHTYLC